MKKCCSRCKAVKHVSGFGRDKNRSDELNKACRVCVSSVSAEYRKNNLEKCRQSSRLCARRKRASDVASAREKERAWYHSQMPNPAFRKRIAEKDRKHYYANRDKVMKRIRTRENLLAKTDPSYRLEKNLRRRIYGLRKNKGHKSASTRELLGCSIGRFMDYIHAHFKPGMTFSNYGKIWHLDHIRPCASYDLTDPEQQKQCFNWLNLQPLFAGDNLRKGAKYQVS